MRRCIMLIRHAEKPSQGRPGVNEAGEPQEGTLSVAGWRRAGALVPYFASLADRVHVRLVCRPERILAARPTTRHPSTRPADTVRPLAALLGLAVDEAWSADDPVDQLADTLRNFDAPVLVCWRHHELPALARAILQDDGIPDRWPDDRFDLTWSIRDDGDGWVFMQVPQLLFAQDRIDVLA